MMLLLTALPLSAFADDTSYKEPAGIWYTLPANSSSRITSDHSRRTKG